MARPEATGKKAGRRLLDFPALKERGIPWTREHLARLEAAGKFPMHIDVGENSRAWFEDEVDNFLEAKAAERDAKVAALAAAKATARAAKADSATTDSDCDPQLRGEVQGDPSTRPRVRADAETSS